MAPKLNHEARQGRGNDFFLGGGGKHVDMPSDCQNLGGGAQVYSSPSDKKLGGGQLPPLPPPPAPAPLKQGDASMGSPPNGPSVIRPRPSILIIGPPPTYTFGTGKRKRHHTKNKEPSFTTEPKVRISLSPRVDNVVILKYGRQLL